MTIQKPNHSNVQNNFTRHAQVSFFFFWYRHGNLFISLGNGDVSPDNGKDRSSKGHPHNTDSRGDASSVITKVKLGQQEAESRRLHRGLNGHRTGGGFAKAGDTGEGIADETTNKVKEEDGDLKGHTSVEDGLGNLSDGRGDKEASGNDADDRSEGENGLDGLGEELVQGHTKGDGGKDNLNGGLGNTSGIDGDDGTEEGLAEKGSHEDGTDGGGGRHEDGKSNVALGNVRAEVRSLTSVDRADEDHTGKEGGVDGEALTKAEGEEGHHNVAEKELHDDGDGLGGDVDEILGGEGDTHGKHESGKGGGEVLGREPVEGGGVLKGDAGAQDGPDGKEGGGDVGGLGVGIEDLLSKALLLSTLGGGFGHLHGRAHLGSRGKGRSGGHGRGGKLLHLSSCRSTPIQIRMHSSFSPFDNQFNPPTKESRPDKLDSPREGNENARRHKCSEKQALKKGFWKWHINLELGKCTRYANSVLNMRVESPNFKHGHYQESLRLVVSWMQVQTTPTGGRLVPALSNPTQHVLLSSESRQNFASTCQTYISNAGRGGGGAGKGSRRGGRGDNEGGDSHGWWFGLNGSKLATDATDDITVKRACRQ